jgi:molecular chaperone DnaK
VFQGERPMAADNVSLGEFNLDGLAPAPRGVPKIEVTFDIDVNGILNAAARDTATGRSQSIRVSGSTRLSEQEKKRMMGDAERYAEEDKKRRAAAEQLNEADALCYQADKMLAEYSDRLTDEVKKQIEEARRETREALSKKDVELTAQRIGKLKKALEQGGTIIYSQTPGAYKAPRGPQPPPRAEEPGEARPRSRVVDAEYKETTK